MLSLVCAGILFIFGAWALSGSFHLRSLHNIFVVCWFYYALSVPIDQALGFDLRDRVGLVDLSTDQGRSLVWVVLGYYLLLLLGFLGGYWALAKWTYVRPSVVLNELLNSFKGYRVVLPPWWAVVALNVAVSLIYVNAFWEVGRDTRDLLTRDSAQLKMLAVMSTFAQACSLIYIWLSADRKSSFWVFLSGLIFSISTGGRTWLVLFGVIYQLRYPVLVKRSTVFVFAILIFFFASYWKWVYVDIVDMYRGYGSGFNVSEYSPDLHLSRFEAIGAYSIFASLLASERPPYLWGESYTARALAMTYPRFLSDGSVQTLAEEYGGILRPDFIERGGGMGFSALAEGWLNFGFGGPLAIGVLVGMALFLFDRRARGLSYVVVAIMVLRFFRSDFASLYKSWVIMLGGCIVSVFVLLIVYTMFVEPEKRRRSLQLGPVKISPPNRGEDNA